MYSIFKVASNGNNSVRRLGASAHFSKRHHANTRGVARRAREIQSLKKIKTNMTARGLLRKTSILQENSKEKHSFESLCGNVNKTALQVFFVLSTWPGSSRGIMDETLLLHLTPLTTKAKTKYYSQIYSRGIAGFTYQRTTFTRAQS